MSDTHLDAEPEPNSTTPAGTHHPKAPVWAWGFVPAIPLALLALFTPWFDSAPPSDLSHLENYKHVTYSAWTVARFGILCPMFLIIQAWQWLGALRGRSQPPSPSDWRGTGRSFSGYMAGGRVRSGNKTSGGDGYEEPWYPNRTGSWMSIALATVSLAVLGISRANFHPTYYWIDMSTGGSRYGDMPVHPAFGCWCYLLAVACFLITGIFGALRPVTPWWELSKESPTD